MIPDIYVAASHVRQCVLYFGYEIKTLNNCFKFIYYDKFMVTPIQGRKKDNANEDERGKAGNVEMSLQSFTRGGLSQLRWPHHGRRHPRLDGVVQVHTRLSPSLFFILHS